MALNWELVNMFDVILHVLIFTLIDGLLSLSLSLSPIAYLPTGPIGSESGGKERHINSLEIPT